MVDFREYEYNIGESFGAEVDKIVPNLRQSMSIFQSSMKGVKLDDIQREAFQALGVAISDMLDNYAKDRRKYRQVLESEDRLKDYLYRAEVRLTLYTDHISHLEDQLVDMTRRRDVIFNDRNVAKENNSYKESNFNDI